MARLPPNTKEALRRARLRRSRATTSVPTTSRRAPKAHEGAEGAAPHRRVRTAGEGAAETAPDATGEPAPDAAAEAEAEAAPEPPAAGSPRRPVCLTPQRSTKHPRARYRAAPRTLWRRIASLARRRSVQTVTDFADHVAKRAADADGAGHRQVRSALPRPDARCPSP